MDNDAAARVYVIDDDHDVREAIGELLLSVGLRPLLFASTGEFMAASHDNPSGCLVLDVRLPERSGLDFFDQLRGAGLRLPIIFISGHADVLMSVRAMKSGAFDFFTKPVRNQDLLDAIHAALAEDRRRKAEDLTVAKARRALATLTDREREVLSLVVAGQLNKQIAAQIGVAEATVKLHRANIMRKFGARSLIDLVRAADMLSRCGG
jgi:FixJ family two-component response regulator